MQHLFVTHKKVFSTASAFGAKSQLAGDIFTARYKSAPNVATDAEASRSPIALSSSTTSIQHMPQG